VQTVRATKAPLLLLRGKASGRRTIAIINRLAATERIMYVFGNRLIIDDPIFITWYLQINNT